MTPDKQQAEREALLDLAKRKGAYVLLLPDGGLNTVVFAPGPWERFTAAVALVAEGHFSHLSGAQKKEGEAVAYLVTGLTSGEPSLCFEDERGDYGDETHTPSFTPLYTTPPSPSLRDVQDAARYRMIRQHAKFIGDDVFNYEGDEFSKATLVRASEMLDEHIDAELARLEGGE